jgi:subtilisin family serine protease
MRTFILGEPPFTGSGEGVRIAVIDSGVNADNPHVGAIAGGVGIADDGAFHDDLVDRVGHGTAVVAAIQEKAPAAEIHVVRVFEASLTTRAENLVLAIDWAAGHGMQLANLSLGTANLDRAAILREAVTRAREAGLIVVSAFEHRGARWWPGSAPEAVGVIADETCSRDELRVNGEWRGDELRLGATCGLDEAQLIVRASPLPRPIPGVPPERNIRGISFAVANASGLLARALDPP